LHLPSCTGRKIQNKTKRSQGSINQLLCGGSHNRSCLTTLPVPAWTSCLSSCPLSSSQPCVSFQHSSKCLEPVHSETGQLLLRFFCRLINRNACNASKRFYEYTVTSPVATIIEYHLMAKLKSLVLKFKAGLQFLLGKINDCDPALADNVDWEIRV
jgi:hypothetical protein